MCLLFYRNDRNFWKELDDNLIYYPNDSNVYYDYSHLRIRNIESDKTMEYIHIINS